MRENLKASSSPPRLPAIGWREWVSLPDLSIPWVKAKIDTGARSSSLRAFGIKEVDHLGTQRVRFKVHPFQRDSKTTVIHETALVEHRWGRSSSGARELRPVIHTPISLLGHVWTIEVTLSSREEMTFRLLLGREAIRNRFLVDPGKSFLGGKPKRKRKRS